MTIIAACRDQDGSVWMGADSVSVTPNNDARFGAAPKIFQLGEFLIGSTGTVNCHQIVQYRTEFPLPPCDGDLLEYMVKFFVGSLRSAMKEHGGECKTTAETTEMDGRLLVGIRGQLFTVDGGYGVHVPRAPIAAIGCADQLAYAAMFTARKLVPTMHARAVVQCGLEAAAEYDIMIRPPFHIQCEAEADQIEHLGELRVA
jgi:ATP-dependent protease HslVU (ClpYQ) peptidase subunit